MAVKNFVFRKNCIGSEVASAKITFFVIFNQIWASILAPTGPNMGILEQNFNFQSLRKR